MFVHRDHNFKIGDIELFLNFFNELRSSRIPVSLKEFLSFLSALTHGFGEFDINEFYYVARTSLVKDERHLDRFDKVFGQIFAGLEKIDLDDLLKSTEIPKEWIKKLAEKVLDEKEMSQVKSLGSFEKLMETLKKRLAEQEKRHQGGSKWIGTAGTSPFGAYGFNPEGVRIGQNESRHKKAVKVWDKREFRNFDDQMELGTRSMKIALKRLRKWARDGYEDELDLEKTISETAKNGYLDVKTRPEKRNAIKVLLFLDVGGSMDGYVRQVEELFSAATTAFKHLKYYYFHNCLYEGVWQDNNRRWSDQTPTMEIMRTYSKEYKCIFVGDAAMSPYEILMAGGANEHFNQETGQVWLERALAQWPSNIWINPTKEKYWEYTHSTQIINEIFENRMFPLTLKGLERGMKALT